MNSYTHVPATLRQPATKINAPPACATCGGLECMCRPRFFAGQLLTDQDLNRLDRYITAKQRLHNRYLHGSGVVCGLEVLCNPCDGYVTVKAGYALGPCGEDIVVCQDDEVNICEMIQACRERPRSDCEPLRPYSADSCQDVEEEWILAICYDERATRGTMALRNASASGSCSRCNCGGSNGCGCGCHETAASTASQANRYGSRGTRIVARSAPAQCEPTVTCETYRFELRRAPQADRNASSLPGEIIRRVWACLADLQTVPRLPIAAEPTPDQLFHWCCSLKAAFQDLIMRHDLHDCLVDDRLARFRCPDPNQNSQGYQQEVMRAVADLGVIMAEHLRSCFCSALLPPCPTPTEESCVMLASLHVRRGDCRIVRVCNLDYRQMAVTIPALQYWLSALPLSASIHQALDSLCCPPQRAEDTVVNSFRASASQRSASSTRASATGAGQEPAAATGKDIVDLLRQALAKGDKTINPKTLLLDMLGLTDMNGEPFLSDLERRNPTEAVLLNQVVLPIIESFGLGAQPEQPAAQADLRSDMEELRVMLQQQQDTIESLRSEINKRAKTRGGA